MKETFLFLIFELASQLLRYFGMTALACFAVWKIFQVKYSSTQTRREIRQSLLTLTLFTLMGTLWFMLHQQAGYFKIYTHPSQYGWMYLALSPLLLVVLHDTYFYWTHRLMHLPRVFKVFHRVHHQSVHPTPYTSYSFHALESIIEGLFFPLTALVLPIHPAAAGVVIFYSYTINLIGHLGHEIYPERFFRSWLYQVFTTSTYHHLHHSGGLKTNFGFYFRFWDRVCRTEDRRYARTATYAPINRANSRAS